MFLIVEASKVVFDALNIKRLHLEANYNNHFEEKQIGSFSKPLRRRQREGHQTKGLMSRTMAVHVRFEYLYISLPSSALSWVFWRTTLVNFCAFLWNWTLSLHIWPKQVLKLICVLNRSATCESKMLIPFYDYFAECEIGVKWASANSLAWSVTPSFLGSNFRWPMHNLTWRRENVGEWFCKCET